VANLGATSIASRRYVRDDAQQNSGIQSGHSGVHSRGRGMPLWVN
jgi:hypothetical protein